MCSTGEGRIISPLERNSAISEEKDPCHLEPRFAKLLLVTAHSVQIVRALCKGPQGRRRQKEASTYLVTTTDDSPASRWQMCLGNRLPGPETTRPKHLFWGKCTTNQKVKNHKSSVGTPCELFTKMLYHSLLHICNLKPLSLLLVKNCFLLARR